MVRKRTFDTWTLETVRYLGSNRPMKHGRTAIVNFLSRFGMSIAGFVATVTLTNLLGKETYGTYVVVISVLAWASIAGNLGLASALRKRVSESTEGDFIASGLAMQLVLYIVMASAIWVGRGPLNSYWASRQLTSSSRYWVFVCW